MSIHHLIFVFQTFLIVVSQTNKNSTSIDIYILGLFPMDGHFPAGIDVKPSVEIALDSVNRNPNILPGYRLNMMWNNSRCNKGQAVKILVERMCDTPTFLAILGAGCARVSSVVAEAAYLWNLVQVSYASSSTALSDSHLYPYFFRVISAEKQLNYGRAAVMRHFNWTDVFTLFQETDFEQFIESFQAVLATYNVTLSTYSKHGFVNSPVLAIQELKRKDARIIFTAFFEEDARQVFCEAFKIKYFGPKIVWFIPAYYKTNWWKSNDTNCTDDEIILAAGNYLMVDLYIKNDDTEVDDNGMTLKEFWKEFHKRTDKLISYGEILALAGYDSLWVIARALTATITDLEKIGSRLESFSYSNKFIGELIKNNTSKVSFNSVSGHVSFYANGDSTKQLAIKQYQDGKLVTLGWYNGINKGHKLTWNKSTHVLWQNGITPKDSVRVITQEVSVSEELYIITCVLASLGIVLAICFMVFTLKYKNSRIIEMSVPHINIVILVGCIILYSFVFVYGLDIKNAPATCQIKSFLFLIGFSVVFGALFAKTWHVYSKFLSSKKLRKWTPKEFHLFLIIILINAVNVIVMTAWTIVDPSKPEQNSVDHLKEHHTANDIVVIPVMWHCASKSNTFYAILLVIQAVFLLYGAFLAFTTRKVTASKRNDNKVIGICIYNMIVLVVLGLPVSFLLEDYIDATYGLISMLIIVGATSTQCLIYIPKMFKIKNYVNADISQCTSLQSVPRTRTSCTNSTYSELSRQDSNAFIKSYDQ